MRGRSLFQETTKPSICVYRFGSACCPSHRRHFTQTSTRPSKPQASEAASHEPSNENASSIVSPQGDANTNESGTKGASWGRPAFGNQSANPNESQRDNAFRRPAFGAGKIELTPDEERARDAVAQAAVIQAQRPLRFHFGPGPQTTRAGRPDPTLRARNDAIEASSLEGRRDHEGHTPRFTIWRPGVASNGSRDYLRTREQGSQGPDHEDNQGSTWRHLRRRDMGVKPIPTPEESKFEVARRIREERSRRRQYTPLAPDRSHTDNLKISDVQNPQREEFTKSIGNRNSNSRPWNPLDFAKSPNRIAPRYSERTGSENESGRTVQIENPLASKGFSRNQKSQRVDRFASSISKPSKGKDRDKAKRREQFVNTDEGEEQEGIDLRTEMKRQRKRDKAAKKASAPVPIFLPEYISISSLATALKVRLENLTYKMEELGFEDIASDHILNAENAGLIAMEYNFDPIVDPGEKDDLKPRPAPEDPFNLPQRPPVVTIMGHVDHGKTTLLDYLRKSSVAATEHGGITQHIGAFSVPMPSGKVITFLDTPGHAAFLNMRQRGANVTDIVVLVVAADDSVKPQTIEAINHAKGAKVPIVVAINKIDKEDANIERVKQDLARHGVDVEDFGGDTQVVCVSGKTGQGLDELEETVIALSDIIDMRAETDGQAEGWVLEASIKPMGKVATVLVRRGTMRPGDFIVAGLTWARIRCLRNEAGVEIKEAGPGTPVEVDGWKDQPLAGDEVLQAPSEDKAKSVINYRVEKNEREQMAKDMEAINAARRSEQNKRANDKRVAEIADADNAGIAELEPDEPGGPKKVYFIVKGDVSGSVEAVIDSISALGNQEIQPHILRSGVGQLTEFDIEHAAVAKGHLINFNTAIDPNIAGLAEKAKILILDHNVIYRLVDDVKAKLSEQLPPLITSRVLGEADVAQVFHITIKGRQQKAIAGCKIRNGTVSKNARVRVLRNGKIIFDGTLTSLKNVKKDVPEMRKGGECGIGFEDWYDFQVGDQIQSYETKEEKRYL